MGEEDWAEIGAHDIKKILIVYYSWSNGNTERIAEMLQKATGADLAKIETVKPYEGSYQDKVNQGKLKDKHRFFPLNL